jgi:hypothetical protein
VTQKLVNSGARARGHTPTRTRSNVEGDDLGLGVGSGISESGTTVKDATETEDRLRGETAVKFKGFGKE